MISRKSNAWDCCMTLYDLSDRNVHKPILLMEAAKKIGVTDINEALSIASYLNEKEFIDLSGGGWGGA